MLLTSTLLALQWAAPIKTIANSSALKIVGGALSNVTNGYGLTVAAPSGAGSNYAAAFTGGQRGCGNSAPTSLLFGWFFFAVPS